MQNSLLNINIQAGFAVPDNLVQQYREEAKTAAAAGWLVQADAEFPDDADFTLAILQNGLRISIRECIVYNCEQQGIGVTLSRDAVQITQDEPVEVEPVRIED